MPLMDKIETYSVYLGQNNFLSYDRSIRLSLESGGTAFIGFPGARPVNWLEFGEGFTNAYLPVSEYADMYHLLQSEAPVFFTAIDLIGFQVAAVHTELDLSQGESPGEGDADVQSLEALIRRAQRKEEAAR
jgi:hypothetical protein